MNNTEAFTKTELDTVCNDILNLESLLMTIGDALSLDDSSYSGAVIIAREKTSAISKSLSNLFNKI